MTVCTFCVLSFFCCCSCKSVVVLIDVSQQDLLPPRLWGSSLVRAAARIGTLGEKTPIMSEAMFERLENLGSVHRGRRSMQGSQASDGEGKERVRRDSFAGPDLPVRFSRISIASNQDSRDPWSQRSSEGSCDSPGHVAAPSTLTTSDFRQRADKDRSFTGSAPPGVRPPPKAGTGLFGAQTNDEDENDRDEPRRDLGSAPVPRPPPSVRPIVFSPAQHSPIASEPALNILTVTPECQYPTPTLATLLLRPPRPSHRR